MYQPPLDKLDGDVTAAVLHCTSLVECTATVLRRAVLIEGDN